jgi:hypothetical protein
MSLRVKLGSLQALKWIAILSFIAFLIYKNRKIGSKDTTPVDQSGVLEEQDIRPETGELEF